MGENGHHEMGTLDVRDMIGRINNREHLTLQHVKYIS